MDPMEPQEWKLCVCVLVAILSAITTISNFIDDTYYFHWHTPFISNRHAMRLIVEEKQC